FLAADLVFETQSTDTVLGDTRTYRLTAAPRVGMLAGARGFEVEAAVGFRMGAAFLEGSAPMGVPVQGRSFAAPWGGPLIALAAPAGPRPGRGFGAELGLPVFSVGGVVNGEAPTRLAGPWLLLSLLIGTSI